MLNGRAPARGRSLRARAARRGSSRRGAPPGGPRPRPRPTALLALTDRLAWGALDAARQLGLEVPRELSVAGIDDLAGSRAAGLTSVFVPYLPMGELAGGLLFALMAGEPLPPAPPLPTTLAVRGTTAPPPGPEPA